MADSHKNFAYSLVATAPSPASSGTSLVVTTGEGTLFPTVPFNATIWPTATQPLSTNAEIVRVTGISTDTLTIVRAQEGTSARTVVVGDQIAATITAKTLTDAETTVATDTVWDAAGDIAIGTGADTGGRLAKGTAGQVLSPNATTLAWSDNPVWGIRPTAATVENFPRWFTMAGNAPTSGTLRMVAIWLPAGLAINTTSIINGGTAESGGSHAWMALYDSSRALLRQTNDQTAATYVAANGVSNFTMSSQFTTTYSGLHYMGICVVASTMPAVFALNNTATPLGIAPILSGNTSDTGLTTTAPNPAAAISSDGKPFYCYVA